jgi:hypothetical protein
MANIPVLELTDELIADINKIAKAVESTGFTESAMVILLQDTIGNRRITRDQVREVLRTIPRLQKLYIKEKK